MDLQTARGFFLWCSLINYGILVFWAVLATFGREWIYGIWGRFYPLSREQMVGLNVGGMMLYKIGIILFNIVPLIALYLVR